MKTLWFFLGGLAVLCGISLSLNVFLLRREFDPTRQAVELRQPPTLWRDSNDENTTQVSSEKETSAKTNAATEAKSEITSVPAADLKNSSAAKPSLLISEIYHWQYDEPIYVFLTQKATLIFPWRQMPVCLRKSKICSWGALIRTHGL